MANRKTDRKVEKKTTNKIASTRSARTGKKVTVEETTSHPITPAQRVFDYFRVSESYTSLILGIVVVVITSLLLIAFLRDRNTIAPQSTKDISSAIKIGPTISLNDSISDVPNNTVSEVPAAPTTPVQPTAPIEPTTSKAVSPTAKPTAVPTKVIAKSTVAPTNAPTAKPTEVAPTKPGQRTLATTYVTKEGDSLWTIAERFYNSGYNWVDIAKANNITNADIINAGVNLKIPATEKKMATVTAAPTQTPMANMGEKGQTQAKTYTVKAGEDLWDIAIAVYKDGSRWTDIATANTLTNPNVIHTGNVLKLP